MRFVLLNYLVWKMSEICWIMNTSKRKPRLNLVRWWSCSRLFSSGINCTVESNGLLSQKPHLENELFKIFFNLTQLCLGKTLLYALYMLWSVLGISLKSETTILETSQLVPVNDERMFWRVFCVCMCFETVCFWTLDNLQEYRVETVWQFRGISTQTHLSH